MFRYLCTIFRANKTQIIRNQLPLHTHTLTHTLTHTHSHSHSLSLSHTHTLTHTYTHTHTQYCLVKMAPLACIKVHLCRSLIVCSSIHAPNLVICMIMAFRFARRFNDYTMSCVYFVCLCASLHGSLLSAYSGYNRGNEMAMLSVRPSVCPPFQLLKNRPIFMKRCQTSPLLLRCFPPQSVMSWPSHGFLKWDTPVPPTAGL